MAATTLFRIGSDATGTGGVSGKVSRGARGMGAVGAAGSDSRTWPPASLAVHRGAVTRRG